MRKEVISPRFRGAGRKQNPMKDQVNITISSDLMFFPLEPDLIGYYECPESCRVCIYNDVMVDRKRRQQYRVVWNDYAI